jgi:hypothetical protein
MTVVHGRAAFGLGMVAVAERKGQVYGWQAGHAYFSRHNSSGRGVVEEELRLPQLLRGCDSLLTTGIAQTLSRGRRRRGHSLGRCPGGVRANQAGSEWAQVSNN